MMFIILLRLYGKFVYQGSKTTSSRQRIALGGALLAGARNFSIVKLVFPSTDVCLHFMIISSYFCLFQLLPISSRLTAILSHGCGSTFTFVSISFRDLRPFPAAVLILSRLTPQVLASDAVVCSFSQLTPWFLSPDVVV